MRNFFRTAMLSIAMLTLTLSSQAQVITAEQAQEIAEAFFAQGFKQTRSVAPALQKAWDSSVLTGSMQTRSAASDDPTFHAFTGSDGKGFVIVAGQETGTQIIGYSMDGTLPTDGNLPEGMTDYLTDIDNQIRAVRASGTTYTMTRAAATPAQYGTPVVELNTYPLAQGAPYNSVCNEILGRTVVTGCVPTAFAIVMLHHQWPNTITKRIGYSIDKVNILYINVEDVAYDWANMFDSNGTLTTEGNNQVANMMFHLGAAYGVTWGSGSTDGQPNAYTMSNYFGYNYTKYNTEGSSGMSNRDDAGEENWVTYIKESLDAGYPIPYQATNSGSGSDAKHIFILDGYTDNNYYHFNWGWGGSCNGYYTLNNMAPTASDEYAGGGIANHNAVFMLRPNRGNVEVTATADPGTGGTATVNGEASATIADGTQITLVATPNSGYTFLNWTLNGNVVSTSATYTPYLNGASDYVANFAASSNVCTVTVASNGNGSVSIDGADGTTYTVAQGTEVTVRATPNSGYSFSNWEYGTNSSTEATHTFTVTTDVTVTATFLPSVTVNVAREGNGTLYINEQEVTSLTVAQGTQITVRAEETDVYTFTGWYNGASQLTSSDSYTFEANANTTLTAKFVFQEGTGDLADYTISTSTGTFTNAGGNSVTNAWASTYTFKTSVSQPVAVTLTSTQGGDLSDLIHSSSFDLRSTSNTATYTLSVPAPYQIWSYSFQITNNEYWYDKPTLSTGLQTVTLNSSNSNPTITVSDVAQSSTSFTITGGDDMNQLAISNFTVQVFVPTGGGETPEPTQYTISATGDTNGSFTINGDAVTSVTVDEGSQVTLVATPNSGYEFAGWYSGTTLVSPDATYSFTASADVDLTATYRASVVQYTVSAAAGNGGSVTINSNAVTSVTVDDGTEVTLVATPNDGYEFTGWYLGIAPTPESTEATYVVTANSNLSYLAQFAESAGGGGGEGGGDVQVEYVLTPVKTLEQLSDDKLYFIESVRCFLMYNSAISGICTNTGTESGLSDMAINYGDNNQLFKIKKIDGSYYLYSVGAGKYVGKASGDTDGRLTSEPEDALTFTPATSTADGKDIETYNWFLCIGGYGLNSQEGSQFAAGIVINSYNTEDAGNCYKISEVSEAAEEPEPTPDPAGISVVRVSQTLDDSNDENYIDGILIEFSQDIEVDWGVTEGTGTGGTGDTGGGTSYLRVRGTGDVSDVNNTIWTSNATIENGNTLRLPLENGTVINRTGEYTLTFPAGIITAADGSEYAGETFTFTVDAPPVKTSKSYSGFVNQFETIDVDFYDAIELLPGSDVTQISVYVYNTSTLAGTITVASGVTINNKTLTLTMDEPLAPAMSGKYSISIPDNLIARAGNTEKIYGGTTIDIYIRVPVTITDITPATGSEVEELQSIAVTYSYSVSANGSNVNNVKLVNSADLSEIALTGSVSGNVLTLTPSATVPAGTYTLKNLANAVYDNVDNYLVASVPDYTITVEEQLTSLTVVGVTPTEAVNELQTITVEFSDAIAGTFDNMVMNQIYLGSMSNGCSFEVSGNTLTITPFNAITAAGDYKLYIPSGLITRVADSSPVTMNGEYTFTVVEALAPLTVVGVTPTESVNELQTITVEFSDAIAGTYDEYSMLTPIHVGNNSNGASYSVSGNVLTITLHSAITTAGTYALYIPTGHITRVADGSDVTMSGECTFTVVEAVEPEPGVEVETGIYNMRSSKGWIIYNSAKADLLSSTSKYGSFTTGTTETTCQWAIYQSPNTDKYYIYSVAASKFVGQQTADGGTVPLVAAPTNDIQIYNSTVNDYPYIFSTDNSGALNHNGGNQFATGLLNWAANAEGTSGGLLSPGDAGSAHRLDYVSEIPADMLETIRVAVCKYEGYSSLTDEQRATAKALVDGWGGVGYPVASAIEEYLAAVDAANHAEDITVAQNDLVASEIQMPEDGKAYTFTNVQKGGSEFVMGYNASNQMAFKDVETTAEFICRDLGEDKYAFVDNKGHYLIWNGSSLSYNDNGYTDTYDSTTGNDWNDITIAPMNSDDANVTAESQLDVMGFVTLKGRRNDTGKNITYFVIKNNGDYDAAGSAYYNATYSSAFRMKEVAYANQPELKSISGSTLIMNFEQEAMATFSAPFSTVLPEGVTAYYAKRDDCNSEVISLTAYEGDALPANQGFILAGDAGTITMVPAAGEATDEISGQNVMGHSAGAAKQLNAYSGYILTGGSQGAGFYATGAGTLAMNKAYLALSGTDLTGMRSVVIRFPGLTDIDRVTVDGIGMDDAVIYDLSGRRVENPSRGIYIVNGKKVLIK